jgi:hypothetical protein
MAGTRHLKVRAKFMGAFKEKNQQASFQASRRVVVVLICSKNKFDLGSTLENAIYFFNFLFILLTRLFLATRHKQKDRLRLTRSSAVSQWFRCSL